MSALNPKVSLDQLVLKALYYRYKNFLVPMGTIAVCVLLFLFIIIPQIQAWFAMKDEISVDTQKLQTLKQNLQTISRLDDGQLDTYLTTASNALPTDKDFGSILQTLAAAAATAGTSLGDYNFQIGDLVSPDTKTTGGQIPLELSINLKGDVTTGKQFIDALKAQLPISDVTLMNVNANGTINITLVFYYAPLPKITFDDSVPLQTLSAKDQAMLQLLATPQVTPLITQPPATTSAKLTQ